MFNKHFNEYIYVITKRLLKKLADIYDGNSNKKKTDLAEMIIYGCITNKINKGDIQDISTKNAHKILKEKEINIKSLPEYGNMGLRKKDITPYIKEISIKMKE